MHLNISPDAEAEAQRLLDLDTETLLCRARGVRDEVFGSTVTYSPKVFIPLTRLCRDKCGYCTFASAPHKIDAPYLSIDEVVDIARHGAEAGCHEALFTLGEFPESRYPQARAWLDDHGFESTVDYLIEACRNVVESTGLLPHANAGALDIEQLRALRSVSPSQGMMIESLDSDLAAHRGAPDKKPQRRLATLEAAGQSRVPFTTGILVGIGQDESDWVQALWAIAESHRIHGHVQEVIVQNFLPKSGTTMREYPACPVDDHHRAIALARLILPADVSVQAPPNLVDDVKGLVDAGIDDLGGISPVTIDHVNPERAWPNLEVLREGLRAQGFSLVPRLTVHPRYVCQPEKWIDKALHFTVQDRSDAAGYARDDVGSVFPETYERAKEVGTGAEVNVTGRLSTQWAVGSDQEVPTLITGESSVAAISPAVRHILEACESGEALDEGQIVALLSARGDDVVAVAAAADRLRCQAVGDDVTYVKNRNINYTNVCTFRCTFCGFSKGPLSLNLRGTPYLLTTQQVADKVAEAVALGATEVCLQGGIHPSFDGQFYLDVVAAAVEAAPDVHVHGLTALEVSQGAQRSGVKLVDYLSALKEAGLRSLPGTAAEILDDDVRAVVCPDKVTTDEWLHVHEVAHSIGLRSNVTMMFGHVERPHHQARHLIRTAQLQQRTGGFTEFVGLPFVHMASPIYLKRGARRGPTWRETVLVHAVARVVYRGLIDNIQASWVKLGFGGIRQLLNAGVNDIGGTLMEENISRAAGAEHGQVLDEIGLAQMVEASGRRLVQRNTLYGRI